MIQQTTPTKLIVYLAFVRDEQGELQLAFEAREAHSESAAKQQARTHWCSGKYDGAIAWWRSADLVNGEFGEPDPIPTGRRAGDGLKWES